MITTTHKNDGVLPCMVCVQFMGLINYLEKEGEADVAELDSLHSQKTGEKVGKSLT